MTESNTPKIESQDLSVGALFKDFFSVPDFQREYVWQREQVEKPQVGVNTQLNRAVQELLQFERWDSAAILKRQEMLAKLARKVWAMPERAQGVAQ